MLIIGEIEEVIFRNDENSYTVAVIDCNGEMITCVGKFPQVSGGERVQIEGSLVKNKYGEQVNVKTIKVLPPNTCDGIIKYLSSGLIKGVGPKTAVSIVEMFQERTLDIIEFNPAKLAEVKGVSIDKAMTIADTFKDLKKMQSAVMFLQGYGITANMAVKIYKTYFDKTEQILKSNPYKLIEDVDGIGFLTADKIAQKLGLPADSAFRFRAGILFVLKDNSDKNGNTFLTKKMLEQSIEKLLNINVNDYSNIINDIITQLEQELLIKLFVLEEEQCIMLTKYYLVENSIAQKLLLINRNYSHNDVGVENDINEYELVNKIKLHTKQKEAVNTAVNSGVSVITGGPGTGKTTIVKCVLSCFKQRRKSVILLAPTGRAAKRLNESTGAEASTIHRALDLDYKNGNGAFFTKDESNPLKQDVIIVDEMSMVDCNLMHSLLKAIKKDAQLILVGDKDQLPSVGAGNVLSDILSSNSIPTVELTEIYRQDSDSYIITNAHLINNGKMPVLDNSSADFFYENKQEPEEILHTCLGLVTIRLPKFLKIDSSKIQVLAPMKKGVCGVDNLNRELQKIINPSKNGLTEIQTDTTIYRVNDKVMQTVNNYEQEWESTSSEGIVYKGTGVFNGDIGTIQNISAQTGEITVLFEDGRKAIYNRMDVLQLVLSYAITIHKSQGSEFDVVIIPIISGASLILTRNLLYTAVTRAKKMVVLVGGKQNIKRMVDNNFTVKRYSMLKEFLLEQKIKLNNLFGENCE